MSEKTIERLARDICWRGFSSDERKRRKGGKRVYWVEITDTSREHYRAQARSFLWFLSKLSEKEVAALRSDPPSTVKGESDS